MNELIDWLRAQLDTDERSAERMEHATDSSEAYSCPATRDEPLGDLPYGEENCTCNLAARKARVPRQVQAHRAILDLHHDETLPDGTTMGRCAECNNETAPCLTIKALASIYSDRDGYNPDWSA